MTLPSIPNQPNKPEMLFISAVIHLTGLRCLKKLPMESQNVLSITTSPLPPVTLLRDQSGSTKSWSDSHSTSAVLQMGNLWSNVRRQTWVGTFFKVFSDRILLGRRV